MGIDINNNVKNKRRVKIYTWEYRNIKGERRGLYVFTSRSLLLSSGGKTKKNDK